MQRYFVKEIKDKLFKLSERDSYHLAKVMRAKIGDEIEIVCDNKLFLGKILNIGNLVDGEIIQELDSSFVSSNITIAQALVNESKFSLILQKGTELNANSFIPLITERSVIKVNKDFDKKIVRWQNIVNDASSQSKRLNSPLVYNVMKISDLIDLDYDYKFLCSVNEKDNSLKKELQNINVYDRILFVIGPEGGFTDKEENLLINNGFKRITLGSNVLRTETASIALLSMLIYHFMR